MRLKIDSNSPVQTEKIAQKIGAMLKGSEVIELKSDLGGGKTTFVRGLVKGSGSKDIAASPTFTISRIYECPDFYIQHFDFYRMSEAGLIELELKELLDHKSAVLLIEWGDVVEKVLPAKRMTVEFSVTGEKSRRLSFNYPPNLAYLTSKL